MSEQTLELTVTTTLGMQDAERDLRAALAAEGFGVLTEVDAAAVLKAKLDVDVEPYRILGVCNPQLAYDAMAIWRGFGLIAPCHIALYPVGDRTAIAALNPLAFSDVRDNARLLPIAEAAHAALGGALDAVGVPSES